MASSDGVFSTTTTSNKTEMKCQSKPHPSGRWPCQLYALAYVRSLSFKVSFRCFLMHPGSKMEDKKGAFYPLLPLSFPFVRFVEKIPPTSPTVDFPVPRL